MLDFALSAGGALASFLGGSAFRMIWGEVSAYFTRRQEHAQEIERMRLQAELDAQAHARHLDAIRQQADLGIRVIEAQRDADIDRVEAGAWETLVASTTKSTGIAWLDAWNKSIRPLLATVAIAVIVAEVIQNGFVLSTWDRELVAAILGIYVADRSLLNRGK